MISSRRLLKLAGLSALVLALSAAVAFAGGRSDGSTPAPAAIGKALANISPAALDQVGAGKLSPPSQFQISKVGSPSAGKVRVISLNAAWCPHCAANSWPLAIALDRFGSLGGLRVVDTGTYYEKALDAKPAYSHTRGLSFISATYSSSLVEFEPIVIADRKGRALRKPTSAQQKVLAKFDPKGGFPAVAIGGVFGLVGSGYDPGVLAHASPGLVVHDARDPSTPIARAVDGEANVITAAICVADGQQPAQVCSSAGVTKAAAARLPG
jgi:hypothetical protein